MAFYKARKNIILQSQIITINKNKPLFRHPKMLNSSIIYSWYLLNSSCMTHLNFLSDYFFLIHYDTKDPEVCSSAFEIVLFDQLPKI